MSLKMEPIMRAILILGVFLKLSDGVLVTSPMRLVMVPEDIIGYENITEKRKSFEAKRLYECLKFCHETPWCELTCFKGAECIASYIRVSPLYRAPQDSSTTSCYTKRSLDYSTNAHIEGSVSREVRILTNLVTGINSFSMDRDCFSTIQAPVVYALIDVGRQVLMRKITFFSQFNKVKPFFFIDIGIYVAKTVDVVKIRNGTMSGMELIGTTKHAPYEGFEAIFKLNPPRYAQYVVFHVLDNNRKLFCSVTVV